MKIELPRRVAENIDQFAGRACLLPKLLEWRHGSDERIFSLMGGRAQARA
jgi:hypothetical protein